MTFSITYTSLVLFVLSARSRLTQERTRAPMFAPKDASSSGVATMGSLRRDVREVLASLMQVVVLVAMFGWE